MSHYDSSRLLVADGVQRTPQQASKMSREAVQQETAGESLMGAVLQEAVGDAHLARDLECQVGVAPIVSQHAERQQELRAKEPKEDCLAHAPRASDAVTGLQMGCRMYGESQPAYTDAALVRACQSCTCLDRKEHRHVEQGPMP